MNNLFDKYAGQFRTVLHEILANDTAGASTEDQEAQRMVLNVRAEADGYLDLVNVTVSGLPKHRNLRMRQAANALLFFWICCIFSHFSASVISFDFVFVFFSF